MRRARLFTKLFAYSANVHHHGIVAVEVILAPDALENLFGRNNRSCVFAEQPEKGKSA